MAEFFGKDREMKLWVEKYRPDTLQEYVGNEHIKDKAERWIRENDIPHLLLHSKSPGTGKTSLAKLIVKNIDCDYMYINASDENSVDTMRNKIKQYASSVAMNNLKVIILDEADYLSPSALAALRNIMESFAQTTRFILTCNHVDKIIDPVVSRTQTFKVIPPKKATVAKQLVAILKKEGVNFTKEQIKLIVNQYYPDIRKVFNNSQQNTVDGDLQINKEDMVESSFKLKILEILKAVNNSQKSQNEAFVEIRKIVSDAPVSSYDEIYRFLFDEVDSYGKGNVANIYLQLAESLFEDSMTTDGEITFSACIVQLLDIIS